MFEKVVKPIVLATLFGNCCKTNGSRNVCFGNVAKPLSTENNLMKITNHTRKLKYLTLALAIGGASVPTVTIVPTRSMLLHRTNLIFVERH